MQHQNKTRQPLLHGPGDGGVGSEGSGGPLSGGPVTWSTVWDVASGGPWSWGGPGGSGGGGGLAGWIRWSTVLGGGGRGRVVKEGIGTGHGFLLLHMLMPLIL